MPPTPRTAFRLFPSRFLLVRTTLMSVHRPSPVLATCSHPSSEPAVPATDTKRTMSSSAASTSSCSSPCLSSGTVTAGTDAAQILRQAKNSLRKSMGQTLRSMNSNEISEQSERVARLVLQSPAWNEARSISIYVSMAWGEVITDSLCREALRQGTFSVHSSLRILRSQAARTPRSEPRKRLTKHTSGMGNPTRQTVVRTPFRIRQQDGGDANAAYSG